MKKFFALLMAVTILCSATACSDSISSDKPDSKPKTTSCSHTKTTIKNETSATCTSNGYSGDKYCTDCSSLIEEGSEIQALGHTVELRNKKSATYTSEGYTGDEYCKVCDTKLLSGKIIPQLTSSSNEQSTENTVYITETGKRYHSKKSCRGLNNANEIYDSTITAAENLGLTPCTICY